MPNSRSADRYRGVDRRTPAPVPESLNTARVATLLFGAWLLVAALNQFFADRLVSTLGHADVLAGSLAILGGVAMFIRWRIDGRAESWWLAVGFLVLSAPAMLHSTAGTTESAVWICSLAVAFVYFAAAWHSPQVDSILTVRRFAGAVTIGIATGVAWSRVLGGSAVAVRIAAGVVALLFVVLAVLWSRRDMDKPWFMLPLGGLGVCCVAFAIGPNPEISTVDAMWALLLVCAVTAAMALVGLQATATRHRALALDAQRERDLVKSLREELEARYAETLHEVRSTILALEGGVHVYGPRTEHGGSIGGALADSLVAELHRLRGIADPGRAVVREDFLLRDALQHLEALTRANGWQVSWSIDEEIVVRGRADDVAQIVHGLLSNAHKHAPGRPVDVTTLHGEHFALVLVDDHGAGVRPVDRERIFERGGRADSQDADGQGLGLHIARGLARSLGGELWVEQNTKGGARFVLALRVAQGPPLDEPAIFEGRTS